MVELYFHSPICLHGVVLNKLSTGTSLPDWQITKPALHPDRLWGPASYSLDAGGSVIGGQAAET
jgi:hypothetical protein